jgi:hypothetical protein
VIKKDREFITVEAFVQRSYAAYAALDRSELIVNSPVDLVQTLRRSAPALCAPAAA